MFEGGTMLIYRCITPLHCGAAEGGDVDLPVARERITGFPIIPASSLKGVWRDYCRNNKVDKKEIKIAFGNEPEEAIREENETDDETKQEIQRFYAGCLVFNDAQLLFLPVRTSSGVFAMITCPMQVSRYIDFLKLTYPEAVATAHPSDLEIATFAILQENELFGKPGDVVYLEDLEMEVTRQDNPLPSKPPVSFPENINNRLAMVSDVTFKWFCEHALEIRAHNILNPDTKISQNLWYEEAVPAESIFFSPILYGKPRVSGNTDKNGSYFINRIIKNYNKFGFFQVGGLETTGRGWMEITQIGNNDSASRKGGEDENG
jgi:CRISPR-associated protein Cmr4